MQYRIVLIKNKKKKKLLFKTQSPEDATKKFRELRKANKIDLPQKYMNYKGIIPVKYEILLIKKRTDNDKNRFIRNEMGQLVEEINESEKWVILDSAPYNLEETFWVYGYDSRFERFTIKDIIKKILMKGIRGKNQTKQIVVVKNKLVIRGDDLDLVICKCQDDCERLHNKLKEVAMNSDMDKLLFLGRASEKSCSDMYDLIQEKTGWSKTKIWRTTTRP
jgi:hypothetical protein